MNLQILRETLEGSNMQSLRIGRSSGQHHPKALLSDREVELLRKLREVEGWSYGKLAAAFEVSKDYVARLCRYRTR
jgi:ribosome-binding protein aMBF1 (putative translation factor)